MGRIKATVITTVLGLALLLAACIPGINTAHGVEAYIERLDTDTVMGTLILPQDAVQVRFEFNSGGEFDTHDSATLAKGVHTYRLDTTVPTDCYTSGTLADGSYFILPCEPR